MSLSRESPFHQKVVDSVDDCLLRQKSIHQERENTMLFSIILVVNGRLFLRCSIVWWQICWINYRTLFEELMSENKCILLHWENVDVSWIVLKIYLLPVLLLLIKCLVTKLQMNGVQNSIEKWTGIKNTGLKMPEEDQNLRPNSGCSLSASAAYTPVFTVLWQNTSLLPIWPWIAW